MVTTRRIKAVQYSLLIFFSWPLLPPMAWADIVPDSTLPSPTIVTSPELDQFDIGGGTIRGQNLFHSFESFSVPTDGRALFLDPDTVAVDRIISRVTGDLPSSIDGLLQVEGQADLFLANPNGIFFGPNGQLDLKGSFIGTTAESIEFEDGLRFSAVDPASEPLLSVKTPTGLQLGADSGQISVQGEGNGIDEVFGLLFSNPLDLTAADTTGLQVPQGETLALVGAELVLEGGVVSAPNGQIYLGSVESGIVRLTPTSQGWGMNTGESLTFGDILLAEDALVSASDGTPGTNPIETSGTIDVQGASVTIEDGSLLVVQHQGAGSEDAAVSIQATETLTIDGAAEVVPQLATLVDATGIVVQALGAADSGDVQIQAQDLVLRRDGAILAFTFGPGKASSLDLQISESVLLEGESASPFIGSVSYGLGDSGKIDIDAEEITLLEGGAIASQTYFSEGDGGDIEITAQELTVEGTRPDGARSVVSSSVIGGLANTGEITISVQRLIVSDGGLISSAVLGPGSSEDIEIEATQSIVLRGDGQGDEISAAVVDGSFDLFGLPNPPLTGTAGEILITTPFLVISDEASISVNHEGTCDGCDAGGIVIRANNIRLRDGGQVDAFSASGLGGDISLDIGSTLILRGGAGITATTTGASPQANGGNITVNADVLVAIPREDSDIEATAFQGTGGNILIVAEGLLGFQISDQDTPLSDINASSELGIDGVVEIQDPEVDPTEEFLLPDEAPVDPATMVTLGCTPSGSNFLITGRGGLPSTPLQSNLSSITLWDDMRSLEQDTQGTIATSDATAPESKQIQLTGLALDDQNQLLAMAEDQEGALMGCRFLKTGPVEPVQ